MTSRHRTYRGKEFNMTAFAEKNAETRAVGNVPMNARGDIVDSAGNVKISSGQIAKGLSAVNNKKVTQVSLKQDENITPVKNTTIKPDAEIKPPPVLEPYEVSRRIIETTEGDMIEIEYSDGSIEMVKLDRESNGSN